MRKTFRDFLLDRESAFTEDREHPLVFRQDFCMELHDSLLLRNPRQVPEQTARNAEAMVVLLDHEGHLGPVRRFSITKRDIASATDDLLFRAILSTHDQ